jgi:hypothetical protein
MIIELFGPPGAGKTTLLRSLCRGMAEHGINVKTVNGYRRIEYWSAQDDGPETRHAFGRIGRKIATSAPVLLSTLPNDGLAARLLASIPLRSRTWSWRMKVDIALLCESWRKAQESDGYFIFEEGILAFLPRPDLLVQIDAPQETLRCRLVDRHVRQPLLEVLLFELGVDRGLKQADISREIGECLRQDGWPLLQVNGADPHNFDKVITRVLAPVSTVWALCVSWRLCVNFLDTLPV